MPKKSDLIHIGVRVPPAFVTRAEALLKREKKLLPPEQHYELSDLNRKIYARGLEAVEEEVEKTESKISASKFSTTLDR